MSDLTSDPTQIGSKGVWNVSDLTSDPTQIERACLKGVWNVSDLTSDPTQIEISDSNFEGGEHMKCV